MQNFNQIPSISFLFLHDLFFPPRRPLESKERFVNLFSDSSPLCGGGWAVRRRQQAIGGQCLVSILSNVRKEKETKMIGFSYYIMQSYMHKCNKTICSLPIVLYIPPARKRMSRLYRGVHKWRFDYFELKNSQFKNMHTSILSRHFDFP